MPVHIVVIVVSKVESAAEKALIAVVRIGSVTGCADAEDGMNDTRNKDRRRAAIDNRLFLLLFRSRKVKTIPYPCNL